MCNEKKNLEQKGKEALEKMLEYTEKVKQQGDEEYLLMPEFLKEFPDIK